MKTISNTTLQKQKVKREIKSVRQDRFSDCKNLETRSENEEKKLTMRSGSVRNQGVTPV